MINVEEKCSICKGCGKMPGLRSRLDRQFKKFKVFVVCCPRCRRQSEFYAITRFEAVYDWNRRINL